MENETVKKPLIIRKLLSHMETLEQNIQIQKTALDKTINELKLLKNNLEKYIHKNTKPQNTNGKNKPKGFTVPVKISKEMCDFLELEPDTLIARTEVTKRINQYIQKNELKNPDKKTVINLDDKLKSLLGDNEEEVTFFTLQKYLNRHFIKE